MNKTNDHNPSLLDALITDIIAEMPLEDRANIANLSEDDIRILELTLSKYLKYRIDQLNESGNEQLLKECIEITGNESLNDTDAGGVILKQLWKRLRKTHRLKVVS